MNIDEKIQWDALLNDNLPFIKDGICINNGNYVCNLGFACDACPFNNDLKQNIKKIEIDGNKITVEELCKIIEEEKGYFDGDDFSVKSRLMMEVK